MKRREKITKGAGNNDIKWKVIEAYNIEQETKWRKRRRKQKC